jgi:hypothetical protein
MEQHRVKKYYWRGSFLKTSEHVFNSFESALEFISTSGIDRAKVFNNDGELVHDHNAIDSEETYA